MSNIISDAEIERVKKENRKLKSAITSMSSFLNSFLNYESTKDTLNKKEYKQFESGIKTAEILLEKRKKLLEKAIKEKQKADHLAKKKGFWLRKAIGDIDIHTKIKIVVFFNVWFYIYRKEDIEPRYRETLEDLSEKFSTENEAELFAKKIEKTINDTNHKYYYSNQRKIKEIRAELEL